MTDTLKPYPHQQDAINNATIRRSPDGLRTTITLPTAKFPTGYGRMSTLIASIPTFLPLRHPAQNFNVLLTTIPHLVELVSEETHRWFSKYQVYSWQTTKFTGYHTGPQYPTSFDPFELSDTVNRIDITAAPNVFVMPYTHLHKLFPILSGFFSGVFCHDYPADRPDSNNINASRYRALIDSLSTTVVINPKRERPGGEPNQRFAFKRRKPN